MQRFYSDRENYGPDFDDRLIKLVRSNPAIYDVNHPNYRRNPVRVAIWEKIASELAAPSKFLQTKWKNIRYNYLQEIKCLETGLTNANIRKRRFTEDLSFLQNTAQTYNVKKGYNYKSSYNSSDNDSNSYMFPDAPVPNAYEVIEIEHSDDGSQQFSDTNHDTSGNDKYTEDDDDNVIVQPADIPEDPKEEPIPDVTIEEKTVSHRKSPDVVAAAVTKSLVSRSPGQLLYPSNPSSPLLTPLMECTTNGEVSIEPILKAPPQLHYRMPAPEIISNATKRKSMPAPFPVLTPINDPIELYCLSLVDSLRNMPRTERERVKFEFAKILKDAKYRDES